MAAGSRPQPAVRVTAEEVKNDTPVYGLGTRPNAKASDTVKMSETGDEPVGERAETEEP